MSSRFSETVERPLQLLLNQEAIESGRRVPASRAFDTQQVEHILPPASAVGFDRILVPTDFSCFSAAALAYARQLAARLGSEVILLHVCPAQSHDDSQGRSEERRGFALAQMESQISDTSALLPADVAPVRLCISEGNPHKTIVLKALEQKADLIVTARHGHSGETHRLLGKTAEFLVRNARCPVLLVGNEGAIFPAPIPAEE